MRELFIVRHGETDFNRDNRFMGSSAVPLNRCGKKQVKKLRKKIHRWHFDTIWSSDLKRCKETTALLGLAKKSRYTDQLQERCCGILEGLTFEEIKKQFPAEAAMMIEGDWKTYKPEGGESLEEVSRRVISFLTELLKNTDTKRILLITHGGCIRVILSHYLYNNMDGFWRFHIGHAALVQLNIDKEYNFLKL